MDKTKTGLIIGGLAAAGVGAFLLLRKKEVPPPPPGLANMVGTVRNKNGASLAGVMITLDGRSTSTGEDGRFIFIELEPGNYITTFELTGYQSLSGSVSLIEGINDIGIVEMIASTEPPPPIIAAQIISGLTRNPDGPASSLWSGWVELRLGSLYTDEEEDVAINLTIFGSSLEFGFIWQNNSDVLVACDFTIWHHYWIPPNHYATDPPFSLPTVEPIAIPPAPTGFPYEGGNYLCNKFTPQGGMLNPGEKGFIYTPVVMVSRRWNYIMATLKANGQDIQSTYIGGWGGY